MAGLLVVALVVLGVGVAFAALDESDATLLGVALVVVLLGVVAGVEDEVAPGDEVQAMVGDELAADQVGVLADVEVELPRAEQGWVVGLAVAGLGLGMTGVLVIDALASEHQAGGGCVLVMGLLKGVGAGGQGQVTAGL